MSYKKESSYFKLIKESADNAIKKKQNNDDKFKEKFKKANLLISKINDPKIKKAFQNELNSIQQSGGFVDLNKMIKDGTNIAKKVGIDENTVGNILKQGTDIAKKVGIDENTVGNIVKQGADIATNSIDTIAKTAADTVNKSVELSKEVLNTDKINKSSDNENDHDSTTKVNKNGNNISVQINVAGSGKNKNEETTETETEKPTETETEKQTETEESSVEKPSVTIAGENFGNIEEPEELSDNDEGDKKEQSPSYPKELQIIPLNPHTMKKTSNVYSKYLDSLKNKIDEASNIAASQNALVESKQIKIDEERKLKEKKIGKQEIENSKNAVKYLVIFQNILTDFIKALWSIIKNIGKILYRALFLFIEFCKSHPVALICWVMAVIIFIFLLVFLVFGAVISYNSKKKTDEPDNDNKVKCSNNYNSCGSRNKFEFKKWLDNPLEYSFNYCKDNINNIKQGTNGRILNKLFYKSLIGASSVLKGTTGISLIENNKFERALNKENDAEIQRVDNISFINYNLLNDKIKTKIYKSTTDDNHKNTAVSIIKPKNIEWEIPYIDYYSANTDVNKLPESIKNYKNNKNPNAYSLNDTATLVFPWKIESDKYVLDCNARFKDLDNKILSNLYETDGLYCVSNKIPNPIS